MISAVSPTQLGLAGPRLADVPRARVQWVTGLQCRASALHQAELPPIQRLQQWLGPDATWLLAGNLLGSAPFQLGPAAPSCSPAGLAKAGAALLFAMVLPHPGGQPAQGGG